MAVINAVGTDKAREVFPKMLGGLSAFSVISYFRLGEGGWVNPGTGRERRVPDRTFTNLDILADPGRAGIDKRYNVAENFGYFQKAFTAADFVFEGPSTLRCRCFLDFGDYNTKNAAGATLVYDVGGPYTSPEIWEIGLYNGAGDLLGYGTVPKQVKDGTKQIENLCRLVF